MQYCSLHHRTLLSSPVTSTTGYYFCFGSIPSFFLELFLHWSPVAYWAPTDPGSSSFSFLSFCLLILFMGFWRQECWSGFPFPSPVDHILSDLSTMTCPSWVAPQGMAWFHLDKAVVLGSDWLVSCDYGFSVSAFWCPLTTPPVLLGLLLPWTWGISSRLLQQSAAAAPYLRRGVSPHGRPSWPWMYTVPYSCLENSMVGGAWQATVHGVTKSRTQLSKRRHLYKWLSWVSQWQLTSAFVGKACHLLSWSGRSVVSVWNPVHPQLTLTYLDTRPLPSGASRMQMPLELGIDPGHLWRADFGSSGDSNNFKR